MIKTVKCSLVRARRASREPGIKWNSLSFVTYLPLPGNSLMTPSLSRKTSFIIKMLKEVTRGFRLTKGWSRKPVKTLRNLKPFPTFSNILKPLSTFNAIPFHFQVFQIAHQLIKRVEVSNEKAVHPVLVSLFTDIPPGKAVDHAPERRTKRHFSVGDDPLPGLKRRLTVDAGQKMFNIRISLMNNIFGQVSFGLSLLQKRPRMNADFLVLEMLFLKKPDLARRIPPGMPYPCFADIRFKGDRKTAMRRAGQGTGDLAFQFFGRLFIGIQVHYPGVPRPRVGPVAVDALVVHLATEDPVGIPARQLYGPIRAFIIDDDELIGPPVDASQARVDIRLFIFRNDRDADWDLSHLNGPLSLFAPPIPLMWCTRIQFDPFSYAGTSAATRSLGRFSPKQGNLPFYIPNPRKLPAGAKE